MKQPTIPMIMAAVVLTTLGTVSARDHVFGIGSTDLSAYDTDGDGVLGDEELAAAKEAIRTAKALEILDEFDTDGDGALSDDEKTVAREARRAERAAERQAIVDVFDADDDGVLNEEERAAAKDARAAEILAAKEARFVEIDTNVDGVLSGEELQVATLATEERLAAIVARYDGDESGDVSLEEFLNPIKSKGRGKRGHNHRKGGHDKSHDVADESDAGADAPAASQRRRSSRRR